MIVVEWDYEYLCYILTLDRAVNQTCTCVNKGKKKRKQVGVMKEYRQVTAAVDFVGERHARVRVSLQTEGCGPRQPPVEQPQPRCRRSAAMVKRRTWVIIAVCPCLHPSLTHNRKQTLSRIKCERWRCPWCSSYRRRKWTRRHEFKSWTRLVTFHIALIPLGKVWIQLFSLQLWVNSRAD